MLAANPKRMEPSKPSAAGPKYLLRLKLPEADWDDAWELCRGIEQCGGHRTEEGFGFCSAEERTLALEILEDRFGAQCFELCEAPSENENYALRVLVAHPDEAHRHLYCRSLAREGYRCVEAEHGLDCVESIRRQSPDLLVLHRDLLWGGGDGVLACLQHEPAWSRIPVVLLTRQDQQPPAAVQTPGRVIARLPGPVAPATLLAAIRRFLGGKPRRRSTIDAGSA